MSNSIYLKNPETIHINKNGHLYYGASQEFYGSFLKRMSGCGPTTATNQLMYLALSNSPCRKLYPYEILDYKNAVRFMDKIWDYVTPTFRGVDTLDILEEGLIYYGDSVGIKLWTDSFNVNPSNKPSIEEADIWLEKNLSEDCPIAFLNLDNGGLPNLDKWHWVMIVGKEFEDNKLHAIIYDEGKKKKIDLGMWVEKTTNSGGFVAVKQA